MGRLFGTDGIRGEANLPPMTPETALRLGRALAARFGGRASGSGRANCHRQRHAVVGLCWSRH